MELSLYGIVLTYFSYVTSQMKSMYEYSIAVWWVRLLELSRIFKSGFNYYSNNNIDTVYRNC